MTNLSSENQSNKKKISFIETMSEVNKTFAECIENCEMMIRSGKDFSIIKHMIWGCDLSVEAKKVIEDNAKLKAAKRILDM